MDIVLITGFTLLAFAANSLLCRMALGENVIDPVSFTAIRLFSGAVTLVAVSRFVPEPEEGRNRNGSWASGLALLSYAAAFSLAYVSLTTGMGALLLFGAVQVTMFGAAFMSGEKLSLARWLGSAAAVGGLVYLVLPGLAAPDPVGALLMCLAGVAWGVYSIRGRGVLAPVRMTAGNFVRTLPAVLVGIALALGAGVPTRVHLEPSGIVLALISGAITSGLGYVLWYKALSKLATTQASVVQLLVPVLAALGGVAFLGEQMTLRLVVAGALVLGGVALAVVKRPPFPFAAQGYE
jgi:drug/metabolite transporter (DMT)-like permease